MIAFSDLIAYSMFKRMFYFYFCGFLLGVFWIFPCVLNLKINNFFFADNSGENWLWVQGLFELGIITNIGDFVLRIQECCTSCTLSNNVKFLSFVG